MTDHFRKKYLSGVHSAKAVYGIILITASLMGFQLLEHDAFNIAVSVFIAGLAIVIAEVYSDFLGEEIRHKKKLDKPERREILNNALVISSVAAYPMLIFILSGIGLWSMDIAFKISYTLSILGLGTFGYLASQATGDSRNYALVKAFLIALAGVIVIVAKYHFFH